jgi:hypothetical protein
MGLLTGGFERATVRLTAPTECDWRCQMPAGHREKDAVQHGHGWQTNRIRRVGRRPSLGRPR